MAYIAETYIAEWVLAYEQILAQGMKSLSQGKDTPVEKLFDLIESTSSETTIIERLSLKKDVYMQLISSLTSSSQVTAQKLVDKKFMFEHELDAVKLNADISRIEKDKAKSDSDFSEEQVLNIKLKNGWDGTKYNYSLSDANQQIKVRRAQVALTKRQAEAFNDNKNKEILKLAIDGHSMLFETLQDSSVTIPNWYTSSNSIKAGDPILNIVNGVVDTSAVAKTDSPGLNELMSNALGGSKNTDLSFLSDPEQKQ